MIIGCGMVVLIIAVDSGYPQRLWLMIRILDAVEGRRRKKKTVHIVKII